MDGSREVKLHLSSMVLNEINIVIFLTFWHRNYFFNSSTLCIQNVNNTGTKYVRIMKQTAF